MTLKAGVQRSRLSATEAIDYALEFIEPYELLDFFRDWQAGVDLAPWFGAVCEDRGWQHHDIAVCVEVTSIGGEEHASIAAAHAADPPPSSGLS